MTQFTKPSQVLAAAAVAMDKCEEAGVEYEQKYAGSIDPTPLEFLGHAHMYSLPVGICEGKKVFIGDELWHPDYGKVKVTGGNWNLIYVEPVGAGTYRTGKHIPKNLTWQEPKQTINIKDAQISITVGDDGAWLCFTSSKGKSFAFQPASQFAERGGIGEMCIKEWCEDMQAFRDALEGK